MKVYNFIYYDYLITTLIATNKDKVERLDKLKALVNSLL